MSVVDELVARGLTIAVAESLTGGRVVASLIDTPGASRAVRGGVVAYDTVLKHTLLGVPTDLLALHGPVHPDVAIHMAAGVRTALAVGDVPTDIGLATTGVAGPDTQHGVAVGTVFLGIAIGTKVLAVELHLDGDREAIRAAAVTEALSLLEREVSEYLTEETRE